MKKLLTLLAAGLLAGSAHAQTTTWLGGVAPGFFTEWNKAPNWSAGVPTASKPAVIPNTTYKPVILITTAAAKSLTIASGATLTIDGKLTVSGNVLTDGTITTTNTDGAANKGMLRMTNPASPATGTIGFTTTAVPSR